MNKAKHNPIAEAKKLWDYNKLSMPVKNSDVIFVLGSNDIRVADYAAELFHKGIAPLVIVSGGVAHQNDLLATGWQHPEAVMFFNRMCALGVPREAILVEKEATNTGENFTNTQKMLLKLNKEVLSGLIVQKPFMERRALATGQKKWPEISWSVTSPSITFDSFMDTFGTENLINILVGDTWRIIEYPRLGFQMEQDMPEDVLRAMNNLIGMGYTKHLPH